jgi:hypothetical protein
MADQNDIPEKYPADNIQDSLRIEMNEANASFPADNTASNNNSSSDSKLEAFKTEDQQISRVSKDAAAKDGNEELSSSYKNYFTGRDDEQSVSRANNASFIGTGTYNTCSIKEKIKDDDESSNKMSSKNTTDTKDDNAMEVDKAEEGNASSSSRANDDSDNSASKIRATEEAKMQRRSSKRQRASSNEDVGKTKKAKLKNEENKEEDARRDRAYPTYRWIDPNVKGDHQGLEIDFGGSDARNTNIRVKTDDWTPQPPFIVRLGDIILINSSDVPWDKKIKADNVDFLPQQNEGESLPLYNDPASREPGIGALDPFVGYVERFYEEDSSQKDAGPNKKNPNGASTTPSQMKVQTRWFFKKEEIKGLSGRFIIQGRAARGDAKDIIFDAMSSNDLILTDQSDVNDVTSILRKATVVRRKPSDGSDDEEMSIPEEAFVCRYELKFRRASSSGGKGTVEVHPFEDETNSFVIANDEADEMKKVASLDNIVSTDEGYSSGREEKEDESNTNYAQVSYPLSPRRVISEGPTVGKIHVGPNHQAVIPEQIDLERKTSRRGNANPPSARMPTLVWDPESNEDSLVDGFLDEACSLLVQNRITNAGMKPFYEVNCLESPDPDAETKRPRECKIDCLLSELHMCKYDVKKALKKVFENPDKFMTIWTKNQKEQFDASYRAYRESLRAISLSMGEDRSTNDVIDYHYRFKLVENFRRFTAKKREKAREMMESVENRMLNDKAKEDAKNEYVDESDVSSSEEDKGKRATTPDGVLSSVSTSGPVNNRIRTWFRTGGGDEDAVGATQLRRNEAASLLSKIKEKVGEDAYLVLAKSLKAYYAHSDTSLMEVKNTAADIMKAHPDLLNTFEAFLPNEIRSN